MKEAKKKLKRKPIPRLTLCCGYEWIGTPENLQENNPLRIRETGATCTKCGAAYLLEDQDIDI